VLQREIKQIHISEPQDVIVMFNLDTIIVVIKV